MTSKTKIGIVICDRYRRCAGGKCLRAMMFEDDRNTGLFKVANLMSG